jgi:hypothetical protein
MYINSLLNLNISEKIICYADNTLVLLKEKSNDLLFELANKSIKLIKPGTYAEKSFGVFLKISY